MRHVSAQTLARFRQGDLGPRRSSRIGAHLAGCARCRALNEDLAGVTTLLAGVRPPPIPEHLTARIQTALATEAARRVVLPDEKTADPAAVPSAAGTGPTADGRHPRREPPGPGRRSRLRPAVALRALAAAAAVVLVAGGVYELAHGLPSSSSSSASSPAAAPAAPTAGRPAFGPALPYQHAGGQDHVTPVMTGTDYTPGNLSSQVAAQLSRYSRGAVVAGPNAMTPSTHSPAAAPAGGPATFGNLAVSDLAGCVNRIAAGDLVLLVDVARYQGTPATVIVTSAPAGGPEQIWVVGTGCSASRSDVLKHATLSG